MLSKGFKFTPTSKSNIPELNADVQSFCRKLRLREFFQEEEKDPSLVRNKSRFTPKPRRDLDLDRFINIVTKFPFSSNRNKKKNISKKEEDALARIKQDKSIILKEADKGGAIVIMDTDYYREKVLEQLNDEEYYCQEQENSDKKVRSKIKSLVDRNARNLTEKEADYLCNFEIKQSNFYGLPKIHKSAEIQNAVINQNSTYIEIHRPNDLKLRPIVAGPESVTQRLSEFIDIILKPLCPEIPSYVKDDMDFLKHIPSQISENTILTSFDVTSLYTNIPHSLGIEAIEYWIEKKRNSIDKRFNTEFLLQALKIILEENTFCFDGKIYRQIKGTAMGTKVAPTYANLVMGYLEQNLYREVKNQFGNELFEYVKTQWKRYLDDCFVFWNRTPEELDAFHRIVNSLHTSIKFTMEKNRKELPFLDILIKREENKIITDIYYKKTDTHQYLHFSSSHPSHTKRNIPYCMARRICTIVTEENIRNIRLAELKSFLLKQKYPKKLIDDSMQKAKALDIAQLRNQQPKVKNSKIIPLVTTHDPNITNAFTVIKSHLPILHQSPKMKTLVKTSDIIHSRRQPKSLKKLLTTAKFNPSETGNTEVKKCSDPRCGTCNYLQTGNQLILKNGMVFCIRTTMDCKTENLIYCITCPGCGENYIGQTGNSLRERVRIHKQQIRQPETRQIPLSEHLDLCGNGNFKIMPFYKCINKNETLRIETEIYFSKLFKAKLNER